MPNGKIMPVNRNILFLVIGAPIVVVGGVLGYNFYQDKKQPEGLQTMSAPMA
jgi:hypothetical protein